MMNYVQDITEKESEVCLNGSVDVRSIIQAAVDSWKTIAFTVLLFMAVGLVKIALTEDVYEAKVQVRNPGASELFPLSSLELFDQISPDGVVVDFLRELQSPDLILEFIDSSSEKDALYGIGKDAELIGRFNRKFKIVDNARGKKDAPLFPYTFSFVSSNPDVSESELTRLVGFTVEKQLNRYKQQYTVLRKLQLEILTVEYAVLEERLRTVRRYEIERMEQAKQTRLLSLDDELKVAKARYKVEIQDRLYALQEAYDIAKALDIVDPINRNQIGEEKSSAVAVSITGQDEPLYLLGTRLLESEIKAIGERPPGYIASQSVRQVEKTIELAKSSRELDALKKRNQDLPYNQELQTLGFKIDRLNGASFPAELNIQFVHYEPIADPNPKGVGSVFVMLLCLVLGLIVGVIVVVLRTIL